jgi:nitroreductase
MEFFELIFKRKSIRRYLDKPVEEEKIKRILEALQIAPTADNRQPFMFYVMRDRELIRKMKDVYDKKWFYTAPVVICGFVDRSKAWTSKGGKNYGEVDVTIAMDHLILAAADEGLGTCWVAAFQPEACKRLLQVPDNLEPVVLTPLGYPDGPAKDTKRKGLEEIVRFL